MTTYISNSEMNQFLRCRRKWYFHHYLGGSQRVVDRTGPLAFGTRYHAALEAYYKDGANPVDVWDELIRTDKLATLADGLPVDALNKDADLGRIMVAGYVQWVEEEGIDAGWEVLGVEDQLSLEIRPDVFLVGKTDMRVRNADLGLTRVVDHKTAANLTGYDTFGGMAPQAQMYLMMDASLRGEGDISDGFEFRIARKSHRTARATGPFFVSMVFRHNETALANFKLRAGGIVDAIMDTRRQLDAGVPHQSVCYPYPDSSCAWSCPLRSACVMFDDGSAITDLLSDQFTFGNSQYARYGMLGGSA